MEVRKLVGWNVRRLRVGAELTIEELAYRAQVGESYLSRLERGEENVGVVLLSRLAKVLRVAVAELLREPEAGEKPPVPLRAGRKAKQPRQRSTRTRRAT